MAKDGTHVVVIDLAIASGYIFKRLSSSTGTDLELAQCDAYSFEENSFEFLSKSAIVYARKLP